MRTSASDQVVGWLRSLPPEPRQRVRAALKGLVDWRGDIKALRGELEGFYRLRVGGYRIVYRVVEGKYGAAFGERECGTGVTNGQAEAAACEISGDAVEEEEVKRET